MAKHWRSLFFLLVPVMTWVGRSLLFEEIRADCIYFQGWFVSAGLICALIPGLNFLSSLVVAACLTPTDPILAAAVVGGKWAISMFLRTSGTCWQLKVVAMTERHTPSCSSPSTS
jgi:hypothetical protein